MTGTCRSERSASADGAGPCCRRARRCPAGRWRDRAARLRSRRRSPAARRGDREVELARATRAERRSAATPRAAVGCGAGQEGDVAHAGRRDEVTEPHRVARPARRDGVGEHGVGVLFGRGPERTGVARPLASEAEADVVDHLGASRQDGRVADPEDLEVARRHARRPSRRTRRPIVGRQSPSARDRVGGKGQDRERETDAAATAGDTAASRSGTCAAPRDTAAMPRPAASASPSAARTRMPSAAGNAAAASRPARQPGATNERSGHHPRPSPTRAASRRDASGTAAATRMPHGAMPARADPGVERRIGEVDGGRRQEAEGRRVGADERPHPRQRAARRERRSRAGGDSPSAPIANTATDEWQRRARTRSR